MATCRDKAIVGDLPFRWQTDFAFSLVRRLAGQPGGPRRKSGTCW